ncbi:MAG: ABC transporter ATP-binding protein [Candidatus Omnitrophica bacterium]|nr:ABC transporter ATP-binding protein [Candidatus Omnitrophota bacterium]
MAETEGVLKIKDLFLEFPGNAGARPVLQGVNLTLREAEALVLAGESGSGKSITALSCTANLPRNAKITSGSIIYRGQEVLKMRKEELRGIRGREIAYVFQEPAAYLNPLFTVGSQIAEAIIRHRNQPLGKALQIAEALLEQVRIPDPGRVLSSYPHQLSGGMNQRVFIAMSLAAHPKVLIADEPTTSLDATAESQILRLFTDLMQEYRFALLFITHNLSIAKRIAERVCIMFQGRVVEEGSWQEVSASPRHFHTRELMEAYEKIGRL